MGGKPPERLEEKMWTPGGLATEAVMSVRTKLPFSSCVKEKCRCLFHKIDESSHGRGMPQVGHRHGSSTVFVVIHEVRSYILLEC
jgi:hypothetical protein